MVVLLVRQHFTASGWTWRNDQFWAEEGEVAFAFEDEGGQGVDHAEDATARRA
jgi:hypothetical protein